MKTTLAFICMCYCTMAKAQEIPKHIIPVDGMFRIVYDDNKTSKIDYPSFAAAEKVFDKWQLENVSGYWTNYTVVDTIDTNHLVTNGITSHPLLKQVASGPRTPKQHPNIPPKEPPMPPSPFVAKEQAMEKAIQSGAKFTPSH